jgi:2-polyprenyl-3-methyl-5-hydroxy-6-metoxy-1,4-benzoquinol methylase
MGLVHKSRRRPESVCEGHFMRHVTTRPAARPNRFRRWAAVAFGAAMDDNLRNIEQMIASVAPTNVLLDLGCHDGAKTLRFAIAAGASEVHGVEIVEASAQIASEHGVRVAVSDLNESLPYKDATFDVVVSNQVIEHLSDTDTFLREIHRVLKPSGVAVISTENLASWHNLGSLIFGWQPFSLTNISDTHLGIGNPLAVHRGEESLFRSLQHVRVFAYRGFIELLVSHGFTIVEVRGSGYFPLPRRFARWDSRHAAFLAAVARRSPD